MTKVGIIGVGLMGHGIAKNILQKGWDLGFLDHVGNQPTADLVALGVSHGATRPNWRKPVISCCFV